MTIRLSRERADMRQILALQARNHRSVVPEADKKSQGFLSVLHDEDTLWQMHLSTPHVVAELDGRIVGYALSMEKKFVSRLPVLRPLIDLLERSVYRDMALADTPYLIMGQVCVAAEARGQRLVDQMYDFQRLSFRDRFRLFATEVATDNTRSLRVHQRCGFQELARHFDDGKEWVTVIMEM